MPGPLTAEEIARLIRIYADAEAMLLERIAKRLARGIEQKGWTERKYAETQAMRRELEATLARVQAGAQVTVDDLMTETYRRGAASAGYEVGTASHVAAQITRTNTPALRALLAETQSSMRSAEMAALRSAMDAYRSTIADVTVDIVSGQSTRLQATQKALDKLAQKGITGFVDRSGAQWNLGSYAEMATRTASARSYMDGKLDTFQAAGIHLFVVSRTGTPCPLCGPWEGRVVSDGPHGQYPLISQARSEGLFHPNCGHSLDAYTEGTEKLLDVRPKGPSQAELAAQRAAYEEGQRQRLLERNVRQAKMDQAAAITPKARSDAARKVADGQAALRAHAARTGSKRQYPREQPRAGRG